MCQSARERDSPLALKITPAKTADRTMLDGITRHLSGKLYADKGYISRELFNKLRRRGLHLITGIRRNMRNYLMPMADKLMLRKRFVIETVFNILKCQWDSSTHATDRSSTPWSMYSPAASPTPSGPASQRFR